MRAHLGEEFYIVWFQEPGVAEEALARDVRRTLTTSRQWTAQWARRRMTARPAAKWLSAEELEVYVEAFERTGFTGGLNWYRNIDRNWEMTAPVAERRVRKPALFLTGERDPVRRFMPAEVMHGWVERSARGDRGARRGTLGTAASARGRERGASGLSGRPLKWRRATGADCARA